MEKPTHDVDHEDAAEKFDFMIGQIAAMDSKVANLTRIIKLLQSYSDTQEQEHNKMRNDVNAILLKLGEGGKLAKEGKGADNDTTLVQRVVRDGEAR